MDLRKKPIHWQMLSEFLFLSHWAPTKNRVNNLFSHCQRYTCLTVVLLRLTQCSASWTVWFARYLQPRMLPVCHRRAERLVKVNVTDGS